MVDHAHIARLARLRAERLADARLRDAHFEQWLRYFHEAGEQETPPVRPLRSDARQLRLEIAVLESVLVGLEARGE